jgi:hypothetical protein
MYNKIKSLQSIVDKGLNVHKFYIPDTYQEYSHLIEKLKFCTIRTDHAIITEDLPFYIFNSSKDTIQKMNDIWNDCLTKEYKLIISDGIQYDNVQEYNLVTKIQENGDFIFEASELKIPLRHMYRHPLLSCSGNIADEISQWEVYNARYGINKINIKQDLLTLYDYQIFDKWLETTKYPIPVGTQNTNIIFWQII